MEKENQKKEIDELNQIKLGRNFLIVLIVIFAIIFVFNLLPYSGSLSKLGFVFGIVLLIMIISGNATEIFYQIKKSEIRILEEIRRNREEK